MTTEFHKKDYGKKQLTYCSPMAPNQ